MGFNSQRELCLEVPTRMPSSTSLVALTCLTIAAAASSHHQRREAPTKNIAELAIATPQLSTLLAAGRQGCPHRSSPPPRGAGRSSEGRKRCRGRHEGENRGGRRDHREQDSISQDQVGDREHWSCCL